MSEHSITKRYINHFGLDLKASDLSRPVEFASKILNTQYRKSGAFEKRKGFQTAADRNGGFGMFTYNQISSAGISDKIELKVGQNLFTRLESQLTVTYVGADSTALISIFYDVTSSQYRCQVTEGNSVALDSALGLGKEETTPVTIDTLRAAIDALANFTATLTGATSTPAAYLKTTREYDLSATGAPLVQIASYWSQVNSTVTNPFSGSETNKNTDDFENVSFWQLSNVVYAGNGYNETHKFDGQTFYRAGVPTPATLTSALAAGGVTGSNYFHKAQYIQIDNVGNVVEGNVATVTTGLSPAGQSMNVTVANVLAGTGFNTNCAVVAGAQATVTTITVDDGSGGSHTMKIGDTAYFFDSISAAYITRAVTATAATTITIAGAAVTVADNAVISNNLRIALYRNKTSATTPTVFYFILELPNNSFTATQVYNDNLADASLGALFAPPLTDRSPPPKGKYVSGFRNQLVVAGTLENPYVAQYSDVDGSEYFPNDGSSEVQVEAPTGDPISAIGPNNEVFAVFSKRSTTVVSGDIATGNIRVDTISTDIGCVAHHTIQEVRGVLAFLSANGPMKMTGGQIPTPLGESTTGGGKIEPVFNQEGIQSNFLFRTKRALAINDRANERYILYVPCEQTTLGNKWANTSSQVFVYEYERDAWLIWDNLNMAGGVCISDDELYFTERRYSTFHTAVAYYTYRRHNLNDAYDYQDNNTAIDGKYGSQWEALGEPAILKRFLNLRAYSLESLVNNDLNITVMSEVNYLQDVTSSEFDFTFPSGGYGVSAYSDSPYGDPSENISKHRLGNGRYRSIRHIFSNTEDQENMIITGWEMECATPYRTVMKS